MSECTRATAPKPQREEQDVSGGASRGPAISLRTPALSEDKQTGTSEDGNPPSRHTAWSQAPTGSSTPPYRGRQQSPHGLCVPMTNTWCEMWRFQSAWQGSPESRAGSGMELGLQGRQQKRKSPITCTRGWGDKPSSALGSQPRGCTAARGSVPLQLKLRHGGGRKEASSSAPTSHSAWRPKSSPDTERPEACSSPTSASPERVPMRCAYL